MPFLHSMTAPDAMKKQMRARPPNFEWDVKASRKPSKPRTFYVIADMNGKKAKRGKGKKR